MIFSNLRLQTSDFRLDLGQSLIELVVAFGLTAIFIPAILTGIVASREGKPQSNQRMQATALAREAAEAVRSARERDWANIAVSGTYYPDVSGSLWTLVSTTSAQTIGNFRRKIDISDVYRNPPFTGPIVQNGGTLDPSTKKIVVTVSWNTPFTSKVESSMYFSRYKNVTDIDDTSDVSQFGAGIKNNTTLTNTDDGEVILGSGGGGNWCAPSLSIPGKDLPRQGVAHAITAKVVDNSQNRAFVGTGFNASGVSFANVNITNVPLGQTPSATVLGEFDGYKTNDVFGEDNYGYLATDDNQEEVVIVNLTQIVNGKYAKAGSFNVPGNVDGNSIYVVGNVGYVAAGNKLYNFDLSLDRSTATIKDLDGVTLDGTGIKIVVVGNYAYVAIGGSSNKLNIVNVGNPNDMTVEGRLSIVGAGDGRSLFVNNPSGTRAYLATGTSAVDEFYVVDTSNKSAPFVRGSFDTAGMDPRGVTVVPGNVAIVVGTGGTEQYLVLSYSDSSSQTTLQRCGGLAIPGGIGINGIASVLEGDGQAFSYILTTDANLEFRMIEGGPGLSSFTGTFESRTFDATLVSAAFNKFTASVNQPSTTSIKFKVAVAPENQLTGNCTGVTFSFVGPTGNPSVDDYFESPGTVGNFSLTGAIPLVNNGGYQNPGRCFRYRAYFSTTDTTLTPILYDIAINYSP